MIDRIYFNLNEVGSHTWIFDKPSKCSRFFTSFLSYTIVRILFEFGQVRTEKNLKFGDFFINLLIKCESSELTVWAQPADDP